MFRVEYSVASHRVRIVLELGEERHTGCWTDNVSYLRDWRDSSADNPELQEALNEAITIMGAYDAQGVRTRVSNRGVHGVGRGVVDVHHVNDKRIASPGAPRIYDDF